MWQGRLWVHSLPCKPSKPRYPYLYPKTIVWALAWKSSIGKAKDWCYHRQAHLCSLLAPKGLLWTRLGWIAEASIVLGSQQKVGLRWRVANQRSNRRHTLENACLKATPLCFISYDVNQLWRSTLVGWTLKDQVWSEQLGGEPQLSMESWQI